MMQTIPQTYTASLNCDLENDCACADLATHIPHAHVNANRFMQQASQLHLTSLEDGHTLAFSATMPQGPLVLNQPALERLQTFQQPQALTEAVDYTFAQHQLIHPPHNEPRPKWSPSTTLTAWLHITNACNLDCPYCYIRKSNQHLDLDTGKRILDDIFKSAINNNFKTVKLKYAGGEALIHYKRIQALHNYARQLAQKHRLGLKAVILSNGTLFTPAIAQWLGQQQISLMISLDGVDAQQDALRPMVNGQSSFARIETAIDQLLLPNGLKPTISITVTGKNSGHITAAVGWALQRGLPFSLNFYRETSISAQYSDLQLEETQIIAGMQAAYQLIEEALPAYPILDGLLDRVQSTAHRHTCGVAQNYLAYTHTGQLAQCHMHLQTAHPVPHGTDPLHMISTGLIPLLSVDEKSTCQHCLWRYRCAGGCPLETYRVTGRFDVKSPNCNIYQTLFPQALRLEGLRILRHITPNRQGM